MKLLAALFAVGLALVPATHQSTVTITLVRWPFT